VDSDPIASLRALRRGTAGRRPPVGRQPVDFIEVALAGVASSVGPFESGAIAPAGDPLNVTATPSDIAS
jgi:hypothetical protein